MSDTHFRVSQSDHEKMKELSVKNGTNIREEYDKAIRDHIKYSTQEGLIRDSNIEVIINERVTKLDNHLASMLGRTGMDVSMTLMGMIILLEKLLKLDRKIIQDELRKQGARYFSTAIKEDKEKKKMNETEE